MALCLCFIQIVNKFLESLGKGFFELEILKGLDDTVLIVKFISNDIDSVSQFIPHYCDLIVEGNKTDSFKGGSTFLIY